MLIAFLTLSVSSCSVWTTNATKSQKNVFSCGEVVGLDGEGLTPSKTLNYTIKNATSGGSTVASGTITTDCKGNVVFKIVWTVPGFYTGGGAGKQHKIYVYDKTTLTKTFNVTCGCRDADSDGYYGYNSKYCPTGNDCNDNCSAVHPGATEICNDGKDNNCNNLTDCADSSCSSDPVCVTQVCGNGIVEGTEQCDPPGECCGANCTFKTNSTVCREAAGVCDVAEYCSGSGAACPADAKAPLSTPCDDGSYCSETDHCDGNGNCVQLAARNCSAYNINEIATCDNIPDGYHPTWDYRAAFTSHCLEDGNNTGHCATGNETITHACDKEQCGAQCTVDSDCLNHMEGDACYYGGICNAEPASCECAYSSEYCPIPGTVTNGTCYYGTRGCAVEGCTLLTEGMDGYEICNPGNGPTNATQVLGSILISPNGSTNLTVGDNLTFSASCYDTENSSMSCPELSWHSSNDSVAPVDSGVANALAAGTAGITASSGEIVSNVVEVAVSQEETFQIFTIKCEPATISAGGISTCTAELNSSGVVSDVTSSTNFTPSGGSMEGNSFTATAAGSYTITGNYDSLANSSSVVVVHGNASSLTVACSPQTFNAGSATTCTATANDSYNNSWDATSETAFSIQSGAGGSWSGNVYTSQNAGTWTVTGTYEGVNGTTAIQVNTPPPPPSPPSTPGPSISYSSVTLGCAYNDPPCREGYECVNNVCVLKTPPEPFCGDGACNGNETCSTCSQDCGECPPKPVPQNVEIKAPGSGFIGDNITVRLVIAGTNTPVPGAAVDITTPSGKKITLITDENGGVTYTASEEGTYTYDAPEYNADERITNIFVKTPPTPKPPQPTPNVTVTGPPETPPSLAQVLLSTAPVCIGAIAILLILLFMLLSRRRKEEKKEKK